MYDFTVQVDSHEAYFCSLRDRVELLKPILQKIARREGIVQERVELEHIQLNPERLTARGPNAREERFGCYVMWSIFFFFLNHLQ